jgi:outer membrane protein assembly factor BamB
VHDINLSSVTRVVTADESHVVAVSEVGDQACDRTLSSFDTHSQTAQAITTHLNTYDAHKKTWRCADAKSDGVQISGDGIYAQDAKHHPQIRDLSTGKATWTADEQGEPLILGDGVALYRAIGAKGTGPVKAVDIKTGKRLWSSDGIHPTSTSTIADGQLLTAEGKATRVTDLHTGEALWQYADAVLAGVDAKNYLFWTGSSSSSGKKALVIAKHSGKKGS